MLFENIKHFLIWFFTGLGVGVFVLLSACTPELEPRYPLRPSMGTPQWGQLTTYDGIPGIWRHGKGRAFFAGPGDPEDFLFRGDVDELIDKLRRTRSKTLYLELVRSHGGDGEANHNPFIKHDPNLGVDPAILEKWYRVFERLEELRVDIFLFFYDDSASPWQDSRHISAAETEFIQATVNKFKTLGNIVWVIAEEYEEALTPQKVEALAQIVFDNDEYRHPIAVHKLTGTSFEEFAQSPTISVFMAQFPVLDANAMYDQALEMYTRSRGRYTTIMSEMNEWPTGQAARRLAWASAMAGNPVLAYDYDIAHTADQDLLDLAVLQEWFEQLGPQGLRPSPRHTLGTNQWVLADPTRDRYLVYSVNVDVAPNPVMGVELTQPGNFDLIWLDIVSGKRLEQAAHGAPRFAVPATMVSSEVALSMTRRPSSRNRFPGSSWARLTPEQAGIESSALEELQAKVHGTGCVSRYGALVRCWGQTATKGDWGSASKPVIASLIEMARAAGEVSHEHQPLTDLGWKLQGKDQFMTWHQLLNMTSGYARAEAPGVAWAYNDHAVQLYAKSLERAVGLPMADVAARFFAPLQISALPLFSSRGGLGMYTTPENAARIGWWWRNLGRWHQQQLVPAQTMQHLMQAWVPDSLPRTQSAGASYLELGSYGGLTDQVEAGPGYYGNAWYFNTPTAASEDTLAWPNLPADTFMAIGHWGEELIAVIPSLELVVVWRDSPDWRHHPDDVVGPESRLNITLRELVQSMAPVSD